MTKKLIIKYEFTVDLDVPDKTTEFDLGRYASHVERELVKKCEEITKMISYKENSLQIDTKRVL